MSPHVLPALPTGAMIAGRYRIEGPLGSGGFGTVLRATQLPLGREVAIKIMSSPLGDATRFMHEAQTAQKLEHPNTIRILDFGQLESGLPFIVFELLRGENLAELIVRSGNLPVWSALRITAQILKSLMEAHAHGVIHRDIKPANIFVTAHQGEPVFVKVLDFGVAKHVLPSGLRTQDEGAQTIDHAAWAAGPTSPALTREDQIVGTPLYMSPEQALAAPVLPQSDIYSVGLVLAEMVTGRPVLDPSMGAIHNAILHSSPEPLALPSGLRGSPVEHLVQRATAKQTSARYGSAKEMLAEVERVLAMTSAGSVSSFPTTRDAVFAPTLVAPFTPRLESAPPNRRRTRWLIGLVCTVVALTGALGVTLMVLSKDESSRKRATPAESESESEEAGLPSFEPKPFRALDLSTRELPNRSVEDMLSALRDEGYTIGRTDVAVDNDFMRQHTISLHRRPCGGVITYTVFKSAEAQRSYVDVMKAESTMVVTDNRVASVLLTSVGQSRENTKNCTHPVLAIVTNPKKR